MKAEPWTAEQIQYLVDNYHLCKIKDIAAKLGRTVYACKNRIAQIPHTRKRNVYSERKYKNKILISQKALPQDRWVDVEDFKIMMGKLKISIKNNRSPVKNINLLNMLPKAFGQYQIEVGR